MAEDNAKSVIEALLFVSEKPLTLEQIRIALNDLPTTEIRKKIEELKSEYVQLHRGVRIAEVAGGFRMETSTDYAPFLKKFFKRHNTEKLSKPALETLAIIAYKQPVTKLEIEFLRNVNVDGVMKNLVDKSLIRISGRKKAPGSPYVFGTTRQFLEYFGLNSLEELPKVEDFKTLAEGKNIENSESANRELTEVSNEPENPTQEN